MSRSRETDQSLSTIRTVLAALVCIALLGLVFWLNTLDSDSKDVSVVVEPPIPAKIEEPRRSVEGRYLFSGTIVMARAVERNAAGNFEQPFSQFETFKPSQYDGWLADLECPVTTKNISYQQQITSLIFNCRPEWLPTLTKYFTMLNLANNHTGDLGAAGFTETQDTLQKAGIQSVGSYDPSSTQDACEVMALPVRVIKSDQTVEQAKLPVAYCAFHYFFRKPVAGEMDIVRLYSDSMPVFGLMHAGVEYRPNADDTQKEVARTLIDNGSEFVIGNSPHWVQESEVYKGKPIFYSTGNFIFDQLEPEEQRGLNIDVALTVKYDENVAKWLMLGEQCMMRADNCLATAKQQGLKKISLKLNYTPVGSTGGNRKLTQLADPATQQSIEQRLKWSMTRAALGQQ